MNETEERLLDKYRGCLIGGAVGDALGYAVEFSGEDEIFAKYGAGGISDYELTDGVAQISDDTQMTLFTANGLLLGTTRGMTRGIMAKYHTYVAECYVEWLRTQVEDYPLDVEYRNSWLVNVPALFHPRDPGTTCISALFSCAKGEIGTIEKPLNSSKGCGGVMRVAPVGLYFGGKRKTIEEVDMIAADCAAITHGHELGYIPAAALAHVIHLVSHDKDLSLRDAVDAMILSMERLFCEKTHIGAFTELMRRAVALSEGDLPDLEAIRMLGEGWVAEETLAIAVYCALKYPSDFERAIVAAVNHGGDSDSTGAVTGNILGAYLGMRAIPEKYLKDLELREVILELADDLYHDCRISEYSPHRDEVWERKYIYKTYRPGE